jgi:hypothetical protein
METCGLIDEEEVATQSNAQFAPKREQRWGALMFLAILIAMELVGMAVLSYRCEHPAEVSIFQGR